MTRAAYKHASRCWFLCSFPCYFVGHHEICYCSYMSLEEVFHYQSFLGVVYEQIYNEIYQVIDSYTLFNINRSICFG